MEATEVEAKSKKCMLVRQHAKITAPYCGTAKASTVSWWCDLNMEAFPNQRLKILTVSRRLLLV